MVESMMLKDEENFFNFYLLQ